MVVMGLAERQDYKGILEYLAEYERIETEKFDRKFSKNYAVNSLISTYMQKAKQSGIEMNADIRLDKTLCVSDVDLVCVFSNMLENAVNGCAQAAKSRRIEIVAHQKMPCCSSNARIAARTKSTSATVFHRQKTTKASAWKAF